ncbi:hypothetical protein [Mycobacterium gordonae]|uniref:Type I restriction modification DNA specificity domain-containing protein n=1 Tax=Mycobacterium gordonae TaxID=1778 RepID=A0A1X1WHN4_MYCGO|nr:hypothetical protein [Mycobacterium gordonae]MCV7004414.1 hypothetical protein [Mycobacterium gordonae]ODR18658.1 hypothetical protein BHQ23_22185 [Mycobacterium gordonae]ORV86048.1 hypothetical protein AWC08_25125 [Mycobacterium gordonae]
MSEWPLGKLADVLTEVNDRNTAGAVELVLSVTEGRGIVPQTEIFKKRIATDDTVKYKVVQPLDIAWNPYLLWTGAVGQWLGAAAGVTSPVYPIFRVREHHDARFWGLVLASGQLTPYFNSTAIGSIQRRRRTTVPVFKAATVLVPPPVEQRRIVDVMLAVDAQINALAAEADSLTRLARARRSQLVNDETVPEVRAHQAFEFSTGVRRTPDRANGPHMTRYLRSANVGYGSLDLSDVLEMNYEPHEREKFSLRNGDVLVSEGSASPKAVGMPAMWRNEISGTVCFQMTLLRLRAIAEVCTPDFAFQWCLWAYEAGRFLDVAGGTNIKHISAKRSSQMAVRLPSLTRQREIALELDSLGAQLTSVRCELARLRSFRSALLSSLLNQEIEIPSSYDILLEEVL